VNPIAAFAILCIAASMDFAMIVGDVPGAFLKPIPTVGVELYARVDGQLADHICLVFPKWAEYKWNDLRSRYQVHVWD
jgi:hypothetical protein